MVREDKLAVREFVFPCNVAMSDECELVSPCKSAISEPYKALDESRVAIVAA